MTAHDGLVYAAELNGYVWCLNAKTGKPLWHAYLTNRVSNAPQTYLLDGKQYVLAAAGDTLYSFLLN